MAYYKVKRGRGGRIKVPAWVVAIATVLFLIFLILDSFFGFGNKQIESECEFHFVDVGQGDCTMVITDNAVVVVDAGPGDHAESTLRYIKSYTDTIDYLILTHPHEDHIGGADEILESINVKNVIMSDAYSDTRVFSVVLDAIESSGVNLIEAEAGDRYTANDISFTILSPIGGFTNLNDYSIVTRIEYEDTSVVVTGDVEHNNEKNIVGEYADGELESDILQISHHGSYTSNHESFIDAVDPEFAVISCGEDNEYGHPHRETKEKLDERRIEYFRTDEAGHIVFFSDGEDVQYFEGQ